MPRFLLERRDDGPLDETAVDRLTTTRFPEVAVEHRFDLGATAGRSELWVCRAPSENHVRLWAEALGLSVTRLDRIDSDIPPGSPARTSRPQPLRPEHAATDHIPPPPATTACDGKPTQPKETR